MISHYGKAWQGHKDHFNSGLAYLPNKLKMLNFIA